MKKADIGIVGLGVMGGNLGRNMKSRGFDVAVYDLERDRVDAMAAEGFAACRTLEELKDALAKPRKVLLMVWAGKPVDDLIEGLLAVLEPGDVIIDGGNSHFRDTQRRTEYVESKGLLYVGCGVSGGEEGALKGPSMMPGGSPAAWELVKPIFQAICARTGEGAACCGWIGPGGAGHFVKMVHNGIEYGDMQLICEAYQLLRDGLGLTNEELHTVFAAWNETELNSYLIEITRDIFGCRDADGAYVVDAILDRAGQKGTGKWTASAALDEAVPVTLITEAVFARCLSAARDERLRAAALYPREIPRFEGDRNVFAECVRQALYAGKLVSYAQGFSLMRAAAKSFGWALDPGGIASIWRGGCIIRSAFLDKIGEAFAREPELESLVLDEAFRSELQGLLPAWRAVVGYAATAGIPVPALSSGLSWFDGYTTPRLPANLLQAQRDYFGAHTYERVDAPEGERFHTDWTGRGGGVGPAVCEG